MTLKSAAALAAAIILTILTLIGLGDTLLPLLFSFVVAYLCFPFVKRLEDRGIPRNLSVIGIIAVFFFTIVALILLVLPSVIVEASNFFSELPENVDKAIAKIKQVVAEQGYKLEVSEQISIREYVQSHRDSWIDSASKAVGRFIKGAFTGVVGWIIAVLNLFLIPLFFFYLMVDFEQFRAALRDTLPKEWNIRIRRYVELSNTVLSGYLRGQVMVALILGCLYGTGLTLIGLRYGFLIGFVSGLISIIPYAGFIMGFTTATIVAIANSAGSWQMVAGVAAVFLVVQAAEGSFITPKLVGDKVGLNSLTTILALIIGGNLMGIVGMLIAIPVAAIIKVFIGEIKKYVWQAVDQ